MVGEAVEEDPEVVEAEEDLVEEVEEEDVLCRISNLTTKLILRISKKKKIQLN